MSNNETITLYTSNWCAHAMSVEGFLKKNEIAVNMINIDGNPEAREQLIEINGGYASVPTLRPRVFVARPVRDESTR